MKLPRPIRRRLAWLTQATFTVGVSTVLVNGRDEILLLRHRFREQQGWDLPGGFVERDESLVAALQRELLEETGLAVEILSLLAANISTAHHLDVCYLARVTSGDLHLDDQEILEGRFFPFEDLPSTLRAEQCCIIKTARARLDHPKAV